MCCCFDLATIIFFKHITFRHVLSNIGWVVAWDSSQAIATVSDLFVAICKDVSIYGIQVIKDERLVHNCLPHSFHFIKTYIPSVYQWIKDMSKGTMLPWCSKSITQNDFSYISPPRPHLCHLFFSLSFSTIISQQVSSYGDGDSQLNHNIAKASNIFHIFFIYMFFIGVQTTMRYKSAYPQYFYF